MGMCGYKGCQRYEEEGEDEGCEGKKKDERNVDSKIDENLSEEGEGRRMDRSMKNGRNG